MFQVNTFDTWINNITKNFRSCTNNLQHCRVVRVYRVVQEYTYQGQQKYQSSNTQPLLRQNGSTIYPQIQKTYNNRANDTKMEINKKSKFFRSIFKKKEILKILERFY